MNRGIVAAAVHADMCDDNANGYSWSPRWGEDGMGVKAIEVGGQKFSYDRGSYECGTSVTTAWRAALAGTQWAHSLDGYVYSGNAKEAYLSTGLFEWKPMSFTAQPGDVYLNIQNHVAMCQPPGTYNGKYFADPLSEFCINEKGGVYGGQVGDQTGAEAYVHGYYDYPWDGILHYNHKADTQLEPKEDCDLKKVSNSGGNVRRFCDPYSGHHMLTLDGSEISALKRLGWTDEGVAFKAPKSGLNAVYRLHDPKNGDHLFTTSFKEAQAVQKQGWEYEGVPWFGNDTGKAVYRLYKDGSHLFTTDKVEHDTLKKQGWKSEGIAWRC